MDATQRLKQCQTPLEYQPGDNGSGWEFGGTVSTSVESMAQSCADLYSDSALWARAAKVGTATVEEQHSATAAASQ